MYRILENGTRRVPADGSSGLFDRVELLRLLGRIIFDHDFQRLEHRHRPAARAC